MTEVFAYIVGVFIYIMVIHFAMGIRKEFDIWLTLGLFALGGAVGYFLDSLLIGFIFAAVMNFLFW